MNQWFTARLQALRLPLNKTFAKGQAPEPDVVAWSRTDAAEEASYLVNRMREEGVLTGTDGPHHNVVKIRPPMAFAADDGARVVETMEAIVRGKLSRT